MKITIAKGATAVTAAIAKATKSGKAYELALHTAAVSCLNHVAEHNDPSLLNRLYAELSGITRKQAFAEWCLHFGNVSYNGKDKMFMYEKGKPAFIEDSVATPFWEFKPEPEFKPFDLHAAIAALLKKAEAAAGDKRNTVPEAQLGMLRKVAEGYVLAE